MLLSALADVSWTVFMLAVAGGLLYLAVRMNGRTRVQRRAADGSWFSCEVQRVSAAGAAGGTWRPARAEVVAGGVTIVGTVAGDGLAAGDGPRQVVRRADHPPRGWAVYLVGGTDPLALRVPAGSPDVTTLQALLDGS